MGLTTTQLEALARFTYGTETYHVLKATGSTTVITESDTDVYYIHKWKIESHIETSNVNQLRTALNDLKSAITSGQDFTLYRKTDIVTAITAADCIHGGPVVNVEFMGPHDYAASQSFTFTIEAHIPVTIVSGLVSHTFSSSINIDENAEIVSDTQTGKVLTKSPTSAQQWIIDNLPAPVIGDTRKTTINTNDSDTEATYTCTDTISAYRNQIPDVVKDHKYTDTTITQEDVLISTRRSGTVITIDPNNAVTWINANLPAPVAGYNRQIDISVDDTGWSATYTVSDTLSTYRNQVPATIKDHQYTIRSVTENAVLKSITQSGTVTAETGQNAYTWFLANLPATNEGFKRTQDISVNDNSENVTYTIADTKVAGNTQLPPGIDEAQVVARQSQDSQHRDIIITSGRFVGSGAIPEINAIREQIGTDNILTEELNTETYGKGAVTFSFTTLKSKDDAGLLSWQENIRMDGGGYAKQVITHTDREPFIYNSVQLPVSITVSGQGEALGQYLLPPPVLDELTDYLDSEPESSYSRINDKVYVTTWSQRYILPTKPLIAILPRSPIYQFVDG